MEKVSDVSGSVQDCNSDQSSQEDVLVYTPSGFQDPFQLLHLKMIWFCHLYSTYRFHTRQLEQESIMDQVNTYSAVVGLSIPNRLCSRVMEGTQQEWSSQLLSCLLGVPIATLLSTEHVQFLDKLDLIEHLIYPLAQRRTQLEAKVNEDVNGMEMDTLSFQRELESFVINLESVISQFAVVLCSLIDTSPAEVDPSFSEVAQALRQHVYWINSKIISAFVDIAGVKLLPLDCGEKDVFLIKLQGEEEEAHQISLVCSRVVNPLSVLHWYEHQMTTQLVPVENMAQSFEQFFCNDY